MDFINTHDGLSSGGKGKTNKNKGKNTAGKKGKNTSAGKGKLTTGSKGKPSGSNKGKGTNNKGKRSGGVKAPKRAKLIMTYNSDARLLQSSLAFVV